MAVSPLSAGLLLLIRFVEKILRRDLDLLPGLIIGLSLPLDMVGILVTDYFSDSMMLCVPQAPLLITSCLVSVSNSKNWNGYGLMEGRYKATRPCVDQSADC